MTHKSEAVPYDQERKSTVTRWPLFLAVVSTAALLTSCSSSDPQPDPNPNFALPLRVAAVGTTVDQVVLGELITQDLNNRKFPASLAVHRVDSSSPTPGVEPMSRLDYLRSRSADIVVGCTGELLEELDPVTARELMEKYNTIKDDVTQDEQVQLETYNALAATLPADVSLLDPSPAQACSDFSDSGLPQNVVPILFNEAIWRTPRYYLNEDLRTLSTKDLSIMLQRTREGIRIADTVAAYIAGGPDTL